MEKVVELLNELKFELNKHKDIHKLKLSLYENDIEKFYYFKKIKRNYVNGLFYNNNLIKEFYRNRFHDNLLIESKVDIDFEKEIDSFFIFVSESILYNSNLLYESIYRLDEQWGLPSWDDVTSAVGSGFNAIGNAAVSAYNTAADGFSDAGEWVADKAEQAYDWTVNQLTSAINYIKEKGIGYIMETIRAALVSGAGTAVQAALAFTGVGSVANEIVWAIMTLYDAYQYFVNQVGKALGDLAIDVICLLTAGTIGKVIGKFFGKLAGGIKGILSSLWSSLSKTLEPIFKTIGSLSGKLSSFLTQAGAWVEKYMGITWLRSMINKVSGWFKSFSDAVAEFIGKTVGNIAAPVVSKFASSTIGKSLISKFGTQPFLSSLQYLEKSAVSQWITKKVKSGVLQAIDKGLDTLKDGTEAEIQKVIADVSAPEGQTYIDYYNEMKKYEKQAKKLGKLAQA